MLSTEKGDAYLTPCCPLKTMKIARNVAQLSTLTSSEESYVAL